MSITLVLFEMILIEERSIALSGVIQACSQVQLLARNGETNQAVFDSSLQSILVLNALNTPAVFGGLRGINSGLNMLANGVMSSPKMQNVELLRYVMSVLHLQTQLYRDKQKFQQFATDVERLSAVNSNDLVTACSDLYQQHISGLRPQIIVQGEQDFLQLETIPPQVRSMLLAAFRAAVLWQQKGGSKFKVVWERTRMRNVAKALLDNG